VKPSYVGRATVWVQVPLRPARDEGPIWSGQLPISSGWMDLLQSYAVLDDVVRELQLYVAPVEPGDSDALRGFGIKDAVLPGTYRLEVDSLGQRFTLTAHGREGVVQEGSVGDSVGAAIGFVWVPPAKALAPRRRVAFTVTAPYEATGRLAKELKVSADLDGNFLRMALGGTNPALIAATVNAVADRFVEVAASLKREKLTELTRILGTQLAQAQIRLGQTEDSLRIFRVGAVTAYSNQDGASVTPNMQYQRDPMFAGLLDVKVSREEARRDRATIERVLAQLPESALAVDALGMIGSVQRSTELAQALRDLSAKQADLRTLRAHYTDAGPAVRRLAAEGAARERQAIPALAGARVGPRRGAPDDRREPRADLRRPGADRRSRPGGGRGRGPRLRRPPRAPPRSSHPAHGARDPRGGAARGLAQWQARGERGPGDRSAARHPPERGQPPRRRWTGGGDRHEPGPLGREIVRGLEPGARVRRRRVPYAVDRWRRAAG